jgi:hypothetical protein
MDMSDIIIITDDAHIAAWNCNCRHRHCHHLRYMYCHPPEVLFLKYFNRVFELLRQGNSKKTRHSRSKKKTDRRQEQEAIPPPQPSAFFA